MRHLDTEPIHDDDATIADALESLAVPALIASVVQITGDASYLRRAVRPREFVLHEFQGKLSGPEQARFRSDALAAIGAWRDAGCPRAAPPPPAVQREIMDWIACEPVPPDYADLYAEELDLDGTDPRAIRLDDDVAVPPGFSVLVIGCGEAGLLAAIRLKQAGIPFRVIDKNTDVGGTWLENSYPGARVDVPSHYYCYSFEANQRFSEYYAQQPELYRYFRDLFDQHEIESHVQWGCEVERAEWDDEAAAWQVTFRRADGSAGTASATAVISGVGLLNRPAIPALPGLDTFAGPVFHSARWNHDVPISGKHVGLVGAGASGFQIGPAIVDDVARSTVFQRTPQWMSPNPRYLQPVTAGEHWAMRHLPGYARWFRYMLLRSSSDALLEMVRIDPRWPDYPRTANERSAARRVVLADWIAEHAGADHELRDKATPDYPPMAKRILQDDGSWLRCLTRDHVELVTDDIVAIEKSTVVTTAGRHEVDAIVLATGFRASEVLWPMEIVGRGGASLSELWDGRPSAYRGISVPGFPNFFILGGPGTGLAHAGSVIFMTECQLRYVGDALSTLLSGGHRTIEPTPEAYHRYHKELQAEMATLMWADPSIEHSWYKAADGKVYVLSPWRLVDYWRMTAAVEADDHDLG